VTARPQLARFQKPLAALREVLRPERLTPQTVDATIDEVVRVDARGRLFALEGLLRLYDALYGRPLADLLEPIKAAEDAIGKFTEKVEYLEFAGKVGAPPGAIAELGRVAEEVRAQLRSSLARVPAALDALAETTEELPWRDEAADARGVIREVARELGKNAALEYDLGELQAGIHELRRDLRWFLVYMQALDGLIQLEAPGVPLRLNCYSYLVDHPIARSRFSRIDPNPALRWITSVPTTYFLALSKVVNELGEVKTFAEDVEALAHALEAAGLARSAGDAHEQAFALAAAKGRVFEDAPEAARRIVKELKETKLLRRLRRHLREGLRAVPAARSASASGRFAAGA
jgi:hypothetical protein